MILLKSFFRKKTTRTYLFIFTLIVLILESLFYGKNYYIELANKNYNGSYLEFKYNFAELEKVKKINNISEVSIGMDFELNESTYILLERENNFSNQNEIAISKILEETFSIGESIIIVINGQENEFVIKEYFDDPNRVYTFYVNKDFFNQIISSSKDVIYRINLKNWNEYDKTANYLEKKFKIDKDYGFINYINKKQGIDSDFIVLCFRIISMVFIAVYILIFLFTCYNIITDEKEKNKLYFCLGFNKNQIKIIILQKIIVLVLLSFIISTSIYLIIITLIKIL